MGGDNEIDVLDYTVAVFDEYGDRIGWVRAGTSRRGIDGKIRDQRLESLGLVGLFFVAALALTLLVANSIASPIKALANNAAYIASSRDYSMRARKERDDEIGLLVEGFNDMLAQIEQQQTALADSEERFRSLVETSSDWIWELDREGRFTYASPKVTDLLGYEPDEVIGKRPGDFMTREGASTMDVALRSMARSGLPLLRIETDNLHKNGERVVLETNCAPMLDSIGQVAGFRGIDRDITNRKWMEEELETQRSLDLHTDRLRSLGEMAAGIAHELNQPLMGVRGLAEHFIISLDRGWSLPDEKIRDRSSLIVEQADRMVHIIEHIRMFAREAGTANTELVQVNDVVQAVLVMVEAQFRAHGLGLVVTLADDMPDVHLNRYSLEEVVLNLLSNARDAVEERVPNDGWNPRIQVRTSVDGVGDEPTVRIEVEDNGVGFQPELVDRAFDPFSTTKGPDKGTGLGLSISRSIAQEFGGSIRIQSAPGEGATVAVLVPAAVPGEEESAVT